MYTFTLYNTAWFVCASVSCLGAAAFRRRAGTLLTSSHLSPTRRLAFPQGLSSNTRYQIVFGLERLVDEVRVAKCVLLGVCSRCRGRTLQPNAVDRGGTFWHAWPLSICA